MLHVSLHSATIWCTRGYAYLSMFQKSRSLKHFTRSAYLGYLGDFLSNILFASWCLCPTTPSVILWEHPQCSSWYSSTSEYITVDICKKKTSNTNLIQMCFFPNTRWIKVMLCMLGAEYWNQSLRITEPFVEPWQLQLHVTPTRLVRRVLDVRWHHLKL